MIHPALEPRIPAGLPPDRRLRRSRALRAALLLVLAALLPATEREARGASIPAPMPLPLAADNPLAPQVVRLDVSDPKDGDVIGWSVAVDGDTAAVGAPKDQASPFRGSVFLFERDLGGVDVWGQAARVNGLAAQTNDDFGWSVSLDGDTLVASAPYDDEHGTDTGAVYVYARQPGDPLSWAPVARLTASDPHPVDKFGWDVVLAGDDLFVAAFLKEGCPEPQCLDSGVVYQLGRNQGGTDAWGEVRQLAPPDPVPNGNFGTSVDLSGDTLVVGAQGANAVYTFERDAGGPGNWGLVQEITPPNPGTAVRFGRAVAIDGDRLVVGDYLSPTPVADRAGAAWVYERSGGGPWQLQASLFAPDGTSDDQFGKALDLAGETIVVGAWKTGLTCPGCWDGASYLFRRDQGGTGHWGGLVEITPADAEPGDLFGAEVAIDGGTVLVGTPEGDAMAPRGPGSAYVFYATATQPPGLAVGGSCPGQVSLRVSGATPGASIAFLGSLDDSLPTLVPAGTCRDTIVELHLPKVLGKLTADPAGEVKVQVDLPASRCDTLLQVTDLVTCATSSVTALP